MELYFISSGNTIYRLDFKKKGGQALAIYSHPGGKAVKMKFARQCKKDDKSTYDEYEFDAHFIAWESLLKWKTERRICGIKFSPDG